MPRGGQRVGAGRKPKPKGPGVVLGMDGQRLAHAPVALDAVDPLVLAPPSDLPAAEQDVWRRLAPLAVSQQTLTASTVPGFRELCQQWVLKAQVATSLQLPGANIGALLRRYTPLAQRLDQSLARFRLTGQGKPEAAAAPKPKAANPWATVAGSR